jgi:hypothetical protein
MGLDALCIYTHKNYNGVQLLVEHTLVIELDTLQLSTYCTRTQAILYL